MFAGFVVKVLVGGDMVEGNLVGARVEVVKTEDIVASAGGLTVVVVKVAGKQV